MTTITFAVKSLNRMSQVWDNSTVTAVQCVEHTINGRWTGSRPGFRFDSGCVRFAERRPPKYIFLQCPVEMRGILVYTGKKCDLEVEKNGRLE